MIRLKSRASDFVYSSRIVLDLCREGTIEPSAISALSRVGSSGRYLPELDSASGSLLLLASVRSIGSCAGKGRRIHS